MLDVAECFLKAGLSLEDCENINDLYKGSDLEPRYLREKRVGVLLLYDNNINRKRVREYSVGAGSVYTSYEPWFHYASLEGLRQLSIRNDFRVNEPSDCNGLLIERCARDENIEKAKELLLMGAKIGNACTYAETNEMACCLLPFDALVVQKKARTGGLFKHKQDEVIDAYKKFVKAKEDSYELGGAFWQRDAAELRNLLLVVPDALHRSKKIDYKFANFQTQLLCNVIQEAFKLELIKPLLYFLAEKKYQRNMADKIIKQIDDGKNN